MSKRAGKKAKTAEGRTVGIAASSNGGRFCRCGSPLRPVMRMPGGRMFWKCSESYDLPEECTLTPEFEKPKAESKGEAATTAVPETSLEAPPETTALEATA